MKHQRAATTRTAHDKTGLDNVKADAAEVGVDGRAPRRIQLKLSVRHEWRMTIA